MNTAISVAGSWRVHEGVVIDESGATRVTVISDGNSQLVSAENPSELMIALMMHLGVEAISSDQSGD